MNLVLDHHQRDDVAVLAKVRAGVHQFTEIGQVGARSQVQPRGVSSVLGNQVSHVHLVAVGSGDVPPAPALAEWALVSGEVPALVGDKLAALVWKP